MHQARLNSGSGGGPRRRPDPTRRRVQRQVPLVLIMLYYHKSNRLLAEKFKLEEFGFKYIQSLLKVNPGRGLVDLWVEFEESETPEAKWMHEVDKFECMIQAHDYELQTDGEKDLDEFQGPYNAAEVL
jgi:hypothetical protein